MKLCMATSAVPGDLPRKLESIAEAGFDGVELSEPDLLKFSGKVEDVVRQADDLDLRINLLQPFWEFEGKVGAERAATMARLDQKLELTSALGAHTLLVCTSANTNHNFDRAKILKDFEHLACRAEQFGVRVAVLALPWAKHLFQETQVFEIVSELDNPNLGLALNSRFSLLNGSQAARLRDLPNEKVFHVQLSDASVVAQEPIHTKNQAGLLPGQGELNLESFVRVLARIGYDGPWSLGQVTEGSVLGAEGSAKDGFRAIVSLLDEVARTERSLQRPMKHLPARGYPSGFEFLEFAVDEESKQELTQTLSTMCFRRERRHVSKSVELWRQGAVNIVVNWENAGFAADAFETHGPTVCDMGLRVRDAKSVVARAKSLGAPEFEQPVGTGELAIPAIQGVGGNVVHFIDEKSDLHRVWDIEFDPVSKAKAIAPAGLRRIDHVAQTMRYEEMQSWLTYYTTTFELEKAPVVDVADPSGVVLSQALSSPEGEVRLNLNGADEKRTFAGAFLADQFGAGVQHVAFVSDDIFETSDQLAETGFERLQMPENYYDDLEVRFSLDGELTKALRDGQMLYDRDEAGEYFQIYGAPIFKGFFFEIVERKGGYQGYGAPNAPIRLAAQLRYLQERQAA
ncbi:4-hydroxyphenylpyruvate dioxygenase [Cognatiyoonia sediminum]|uniref:3-dehydroshikimate dehydratase n=2 Tax=Cognatiyoonia sediminum TaxID=1508389 RepID=A0A1M5TA86_9RHOB|nr:4-hydroxyphenylpyruvate dioxygenase [Cognatiyoonia sediminum]